MSISRHSLLRAAAILGSAILVFVLFGHVHRDQQAEPSPLTPPKAAAVKTSGEPVSASVESRRAGSPDGHENASVVSTNSTTRTAYNPSRAAKESDTRTDAVSAGDNASPGLAPAPASGGAADSPRSVTAILADADLRNPAVRERVAAQLKDRADRRREDAYAKANRLGIPIRIENGPNGRVMELQGFDGDKPLYYSTFNADAAISGHVTPLYSAPYSLNGSSLTLGVWDGGSVRSTHAEFAGRVALKNSSAALDDHATHVAGTMVAGGSQAAAKGMAPSARLDSYDWNSDLAEMVLAGASSSGDTNKLPVSNHSYGYISGYLQTDYNRWRWYGSGTTASDVEPEFGRYSSYARDWDAVAFSLPYYTIFKAAGNDRTDNPTAGDQIDNATGGFLFSYNQSQHPGGDGVYRSGYENIGYAAVAKNIITIGAVNDAVNAGSRSVPGASMSSFSSWGPTDDGRIKPDLVANGIDLYSPTAGGNTAYASYSGTSMASPAAAGAAAMLIEHYAGQFAGQFMSSSMLKALMIHTADDLGAAGPDYTFGWGLVNAAAAADLITLHKQSAASPKLIQSQVTAEQTSYTHTFEWDGSSPIRATLCWTDPVGAEQAMVDSRTSVLVHNLDLKITGPDSQEHLPYTMPFVGTWTTASMSQQAVPGKNDTDNVEQVYIASPPQAGTYTVTVSLDGSLTRSQQDFSLVLSGGALDGTDTAVISLQGNLDFGTVAVGSSAQRPLTIVNLGSATLNVSGITLPAGFSGSWSGAIAPGGSQDTTLTFTPPSAAFFSGSLQVQSDASAGTGLMAISGTGQGAVTALQNGQTVSGLSGTQGTELFFVLDVPADQTTLGVEMSGSGDADLYVRFGSLPTVSEWDYRPYLDGSTESVTVSPPAAGQWYVMIRGYTAYSALSLTATYSPPNETTRVIRLEGDLAYGNIPVGGTIAKPLTLHNDGNGPLNVTGITLPTGFSNTWAGVIQPGGSQAVDILFTPTAEQIYTGVVTVVSDKTAGDHTLPVSGTGVESHIPLQNGIQAGPFSSQADGQIRFFIDVPADQDVLRVTAYNDVENLDILVRQGADPTLADYDARASEGAQPGVVELQNPAAGRWYIMLLAVAPYRDVRLVAEYEITATTERIIRLDGDLDFGAVRVNESVSRSFTVYNDGNAPLNVTGITCPPGYAGDAAFSVSAGGSQLVMVAFTPVSATAYNGSLSVQSNADSGTNTLPVSGSGIADGGPQLLENGVPVTGLSGAAGKPQHYAIDVPAGATLLSVLISGGTGDADLYVRHAAAPTLEAYDYRPYLDGNNETVLASTPASGRWYIMLHGYRAYSGVMLTAEYMTADEAVDLSVALDATGLPWSTGGSVGWLGQTDVTHDGVDAGRSGAITDNQQSWMQTSVSGPGTLSFWWKVSSEAGYDGLLFAIDGVGQQQLTGEQDWTPVNVTVPSGTHTLSWFYLKDESISQGADAGWVDQVVWVANRPQRFDSRQAVTGVADNRWSFMTAWNLSTGSLDVSPAWRNGPYTWEHDASAPQQWIARFTYDQTTGRTTTLAWYYRQSHVQ